MRDKRPPRPPEPALRRGLDDAMWDLMQVCWKTRPTDRPDMKEVIHRLMPGYKWEDDMNTRHTVRRSESCAVIFKDEL